MNQGTNVWLKYTVVLTVAALLFVPLPASAATAEEAPTLEERIETMNEQSPPGVSYEIVTDEETGERQLKVTQILGDEDGDPGASASCGDFATGLPQQCSAGPIPLGFFVQCTLTISIVNHGTFTADCNNSFGSEKVTCTAPTIVIADILLGQFSCSFPGSGNVFDGSTISVDGSASNTPIGSWEATVQA